jgi:prepilin-type processing-associated H-X9-DG protein
MNTQRTHSIHGFTLVELVLVIGILMVLATLVLRGYAVATNSAKSAACKSNLRQIGLNLSIYVDEKNTYPADLMGMRSYLALPAAERKTFQCPSIRHTELPAETVWYVGTSPASQTDPSRSVVMLEDYGYNQNGSGARALNLGLGGATGAGVRPQQIQNPSGMIAVSDVYFQYLFWNQSAPVNPGGIPPWHPYRHNDGSNQLFCDGHIEFAKRKDLQRADNAVRRRWNSDNQPHTETWPAL